MDCNKEEAFRAMNAAEKKLQVKDFLAAKKYALKAQQLFPGLENIAHMLAVCDVHCAAVQVNGTVDWYNILQVETTADELIIRKQYRKFALLLHPDKNKFSGAEAAFKLIGEANLTLSDKLKRSQYDLKRKGSRAVASKPRPQTQVPKQSSFVRVHPVASNNFNNNANANAGMYQPNQNQAQTDGHNTFWTACPYCNMYFQYLRAALNKNTTCQMCKRNFTAFDLNPMHFARMDQNSNLQRNAGFCNVMFQNTCVNPPVSRPSTSVGTEFEAKSGNIARENSHMESNPANEEKSNFGNINLKEGKKREDIPEFQGNSKAKRRKNSKEERSVNDTESSESDEDFVKEANNYACENPRRSTRRRQNIFYNENVGDDEDQTTDYDPLCSLKVPKRNESYPQSRNADKDKMHLESDKVDAAFDKPDGILTFAETDFFDFQQKRDANAFATNQIWALYDDTDGMPRYYARISHVYSPGFMVKYTWLEHSPANQAEKEWSGANLPVGCGDFRTGRSQLSEDPTLFSHLVVSWAYGSRKNSYTLYPKKGEIWALFKDWDIKWKSNPPKHKEYKYDVVEVLSDCTRGAGVVVAPLIKVKGFVSLFVRASRVINEDHDILRISPDKLLMLSHMIPSYKMTGKERERIPLGSYELDTASLPLNFDDVFPSVSFEQISAEIGDINNGSYSESSGLNNHGDNMNIRDGVRPNHDKSFLHEDSGSLAKDQEKSIHSSTETHSDRYVGNEGVKTSEKVEHMDSGTAFYDYPDTEFCNFENEPNKFQCGQIWALYSDTDTFPNYYAMVRAVEMDPFKVHISWLEHCPMLAEERKWYEKHQCIGCGMYKLLTGKRDMEEYESVAPFSHQVTVEAGNRKNQFYIHPNVSQVWAVYKNWNIDWEESDRTECEYELVEIISGTTSSIKVNILEKVKGYVAVFKQRRDDDGAIMEFPRSEWMRFSHRIPSFQLTEEKGGKLRNCWELDPVSVPETLLCTDDY